MTVKGMDDGSLPKDEELYNKSKKIVEGTSAFDEFMAHRKRAAVLLDKLILLRSKIRSQIANAG